MKTGLIRKLISIGNVSTSIFAVFSLPNYRGADKAIVNKRRVKKFNYIKYN